MADSAFQSDREQRNRDNEDSLYKLVALDKQREEAYFKLVDLDKDHLDAVQKEAKLRQDDWRNQQADSERFYRQLLAAESSYQSVLAGRSKLPGASPPSLSPGGGFGGGASGAASADTLRPFLQQAAASFALPTTALGVFAVALTTAKKAIDSYNAGFTVVGFNQGRSEDAFARSMDLFKINGQAGSRNSNQWGGGLFGHEGSGYEDVTSYRERGLNIRRAAFDRQEQEGAVAINERADAQRRVLEREQAGWEAKVKFGGNNNAAFAAIQRQFTGAKEQALAGAGNTFGYGRQEEQEDISRRSARDEQLARIKADVQRETAIYQAQHPLNQAHERELSYKENEAKGNVESDRFNMNKARDSGQEELAFNLNQKFQADQTALESIVNQQREVHNKVLSEEKDHYERLNNAGKEWASTLTADRNAISAVIQQEKARKQSAAENLGIQHPAMRAALVRISEDYKAGKQWTREEFETAKQHPEFFGPALRQMGARIGQRDADKIYANMGLDARRNALGGERVGIDNKIQVDVAGLDKQLANQVTEQLLPKLTVITAQIQQQAQIALDKLMEQIRANKIPPVVN